MIGNPEAIQTEVYTGMMQYFVERGQFPSTLDALVTEGYLDSLPQDDTEGYSYMYPPSEDRRSFRLCMVTMSGSESCASFPFATPTSTPI